MEVLVLWVKNIVIFIVITSMIKNLTGKKLYLRYMKLFIGMILIITVFSPLIKLFTSGDIFKVKYKEYMSILEAEDYSALSIDGDAVRERYIEQEYRSQLQKDIYEIIAGYNYTVVRLDMDIDFLKTDYGDIKSIAAIIKSTEYLAAADITVEAVTVGNNSISEKKDEEAVSHSETVKMIKDKLNYFYNIKSDNINITIQEGKDG